MLAGSFPAPQATLARPSWGQYSRSVKRPLIAGSVALALSCLAFPQVTRGEPLPPSAADLVGARGLALSAYRGMASGNDGIFLNPAAIAARRRYSVELQYLFGQAGSFRDAHLFGASVVDSQLSSVAAGASATRLLAGETQGWVVDVATAGAIARGFLVGVATKYLSLDADENASGFTTDAGLFWEVTPMFALGVAGYNLVGVGDAEQAPRGMGAGISAGSETSVRLAADWRGDFERRDGELTHAFAAGVEVLLGRMFPLRAGFLADRTRDGKFWSAGAGVVSNAGIALDLGYRQEVSFPEHRAIAVGLKWYPRVQ
jgi:hypothetical protein